MSPTNMVDKAVSVLFHLRDSHGPQGLSSIARSVELPKSSVHRLLSTLARRGLAERDARGRYALGFALVSLGLGALEAEPVVEAARPSLVAEAQRLGETVFLVGPRSGRLLVLDKVEGTGFMRASPQIGTAIPLTGTAVGKLFLAFAPSEVSLETDEDDSLFVAPPRKVSREKTRRDVARARKRGFAENREEWIPGLSVIAAPVFRLDRMVAAIAIAMPSAHLLSLTEATVTDRAMSAASEIGARLDGTGLGTREVTV